MKIRKEFRWDGTLGSILKNANQADAGLWGFRVRSLDGSDLDNVKPYQQVKFFIHGNERVYPNEILLQDDRSDWYVINE